MKTLMKNSASVIGSEGTFTRIARAKVTKLISQTLVGIVLLMSVGVKQAFAIKYVVTQERINELNAEYRTLTTQQQQVKKGIADLCKVLSSSQRMFVFSLHGSNRWEHWTTNQVATRLRGLSANDAGYRAYWNTILQQHLGYSQQVRNQMLPQAQQQLAQINKRLQYVAFFLANSIVDGKDTNGGLTNVSINQSPVHIRLRDHGTQDNDIVQLFVNGVYQRQISLTSDGTTITLPLAFGQHRLEVLAVNEGSEGPNTASISITGVVKGKPDQEWRLNQGQRASMWIDVGR